MGSSMRFAITPDGRTLATVITAHKDGEVWLWDLGMQDRVGEQRSE
jgi:hypothetical protein